MTMKNEKFPVRVELLLNISGTLHNNRRFAASDEFPTSYMREDYVQELVESLREENKSLNDAVVKLTREACIATPPLRKGMLMPMTMPDREVHIERLEERCERLEKAYLSMCGHHEELKSKTMAPTPFEMLTR